MALSVNTTITRMMDEPDYPVIVHAKQNDKRTRFVTLRCSDTENGFSTVTEQIDSYSEETVERQTDALHPDAAGMNQVGDAFLGILELTR